MSAQLEFTSAAAVVRSPAISDVPEQLRGRSFTIITVIHPGTAAEADYALFAGGHGTDRAGRRRGGVRGHGRACRDEPVGARQMYLNLADTRRDPASFWTPQAYDRLRRIKTAVDPDNLVRSNHPVPPHQ